MKKCRGLGYNKGEKNPMFGKKRISPFLGRKHTLESIESIRISKLGNKNPQYGHNHKGDKGPSWKGDNVGVAQLHKWLRKNLLKPELCQICNEKPPYDLANVTGIYNRDFSNWQYLCRRCHMLSDGRMKNLKQYQEISNGQVM